MITICFGHSAFSDDSDVTDDDACNVENSQLSGDDDFFVHRQTTSNPGTSVPTTDEDPSPKVGTIRSPLFFIKFLSRLFACTSAVALS